MSQESRDHQPPRSAIVVAGAAVALIAAVGVGLGAGYLVFGGTSDLGSQDPATAAATHVDHSCATIERLEREFPTQEELEEIDEGGFNKISWEIAAVSTLLTAAGEIDPDYAELSEAGQELAAMQNRLEFDGMFDRVIQACAQR